MLPSVFRGLSANRLSSVRVMAGSALIRAAAATALGIGLELCSPHTARADEARSEPAAQIWLGVLPTSVGTLKCSELTLGVDFAPRDSGFGGDVFIGYILEGSEDSSGFVAGVDGVWIPRGNNKIIRPRLRIGLLYAKLDYYTSQSNSPANIGWQVGAAIELGPPERVWSPLVLEVVYRGLEFDAGPGDSRSKISLSGFQFNIGFKFHSPVQ
jgi:opacity protein-like surface antigen